MTNPLLDVLPPKWRRTGYALVSLAGLFYAAYTVGGGDWKKALGSVVVALVTGTAHANTPKPAKSKPEHAAGSADLGFALLVAIAIGVAILLFHGRLS